MTDTIIVAVLSLVGTCLGSIVSVLTANKLTNFKIDELTKKVEKHNSVVERVFGLEKENEVILSRLELINDRIKRLEEIGK